MLDQQPLANARGAAPAKERSNVDLFDVKRTTRFKQIFRRDLQCRDRARGDELRPDDGVATQRCVDALDLGVRERPRR